MQAALCLTSARCGLRIAPSTSWISSRAARQFRSCPGTFLRQQSTTSKQVAAAAKTKTQYAYPERFVVYHAGSGKIALVGLSKLTALLLFPAACLLVAPALYYDPGSPDYLVPISIIAGAIPLLFVSYTSAPFVAWIQIRLPLAARKSRENLLRWAQSIPPDTEATITSMRHIGTARQTRARFAELQPRRGGGLGDIANVTLVRGLTGENGIGNGAGAAGGGLRTAVLEEKRPWYMGKEPTRFFVGGENNKSKEPAVWRVLEGKLTRR